MDCCRCSNRAGYFKDPKTGCNSSRIDHAFCDQCWEDVYRLASRDLLLRYLWASVATTREKRVDKAIREGNSGTVFEGRANAYSYD